MEPGNDAFYLAVSQFVIVVTTFASGQQINFYGARFTTDAPLALNVELFC
jgi:hypothetical protein